MSGDHHLPLPLARIHKWVGAQPWLRRFTLMNRLLLAMAFLPTGLVKATGHRFTLLPIDNPVGFFFEAMYRTGPYWYFIGLMQIAAALLLLVPATATLGALLAFPITLSIFLITFGIGFKGTVYVTFGMLLSTTYLICWDADRIAAAGSHVWGRGRRDALLEGANWIEKTGWIVGGLTGIGLFLITRSFLSSSLTRPLLIVGVGAFVLVVAGWIVGFVRRERGAPAADQ